MLSPLAIECSADWLVHASYYNRLWHQCDDLIRQESFATLNKIKQKYYNNKRLLLLHQKQTCQLTALRIAYDDHVTDTDNHLILTLDANETGVAGNGIFYSLYDKNQPEYKCHIPRNVLNQHLTKKEQRFFNLEFFD